MTWEFEAISVTKERFSFAYKSFFFCPPSFGNEILKIIDCTLQKVQASIKCIVYYLQEACLKTVMLGSQTSNDPSETDFCNSVDNFVDLLWLFGRNYSAEVLGNLDSVISNGLWSKNDCCGSCKGQAFVFVMEFWTIGTFILSNTGNWFL